MRTRRQRSGWTWTILLIALVGFACRAHPGIYHDVRSGENLFRIAQAYDQNFQELAEINSIDDPNQLKIGDRVFIPGASHRRAVATAPGERIETARAPIRSESPRRMTPTSEDRSVGAPAIKTYRDTFIWPVDGKISSTYGPRARNFHDGLDISAPEGTPIRAAASGRVIYSDRKLRGYGNLIIIKHEGVLSTVYAHNQSNLVQRNDFVEKGQIIAKVGKTGRASGPHLHFEVRKGRKAANPLFYLPKR